MEFTPSNLDDIRRYYLGTFLKFKETGDALYYLKTVDPYKVEGVSATGDILRLYLSEEHPYEADYVLPHKSYYQLGQFAAQLFRVPAKQYQRGVGAENTQIRVLKGGDFKPADLGFETLLPFVQKQKFYTLREAIDNAPDKHSCVLSPRMAYCKVTQKIYIDTKAIAKVVNNSVVRIGIPIFENEVKDLLKANNEDFKVTCK